MAMVMKSMVMKAMAIEVFNIPDKDDKILMIVMKVNVKRMVTVTVRRTGL